MIKLKNNISRYISMMLIAVTVAGGLPLEALAQGDSQTSPNIDPVYANELRLIQQAIELNNAEAVESMLGVPANIATHQHSISIEPTLARADLTQTLPEDVWLSQVFNINDVAHPFVITLEGAPAGTEFVHPNYDVVWPSGNASGAVIAVPNGIQINNHYTGFRLRVPAQETAGSLSFTITPTASDDSGLVGMDFRVSNNSANATPHQNSPIGWNANQGIGTGQYSIIIEGVTHPVFCIEQSLQGAMSGAYQVVATESTNAMLNAIMYRTAQYWDNPSALGLSNMAEMNLAVRVAIAMGYENIRLTQRSQFANSDAVMSAANFLRTGVSANMQVVAQELSPYILPTEEELALFPLSQEVRVYIDEMGSDFTYIYENIEISEEMQLEEIMLYRLSKISAVETSINPLASEFRAYIFTHPTRQNVIGFRQADVIPSTPIEGTLSWDVEELPSTTPPSTEPPPTTTPEPHDTAVRIQKVDALSRDNIPGALMRLRGMTASVVTLPDGQEISLNNTGINISQVLTAGATTAVPSDVTSEVIDGVWTLTGLPYGFYIVEEERAPDGYSLLPGHTAFGFWITPPNVRVEIDQPDFNLDADADESSVNVNVNVGGGNHASGGGGDPEAGWNWNWNVTIPGSDMPLPDFEIIETPNPSSVLLTFENYPFSNIVVYKHSSVTNAPLAGAHIRIQGWFVEGNAPQITDRVEVTDESGRIVFEGLPAGTYTITEVQSPQGYMLDMPNHHSVNVSWGQTEGHPTRPAPIVRFYNTPYSSVLVEKRDFHTGELLDGAYIVLEDPSTGRTWSGHTEGGTIRLGQDDGVNVLSPGTTFIVREMIPPPGFNLDGNTVQNIVLVPGDDNTVTFFNTRMPYIEIIKLDQILGTPIAGAWFEVYFLGAGQGTASGNIGPTGPLTGSPFITDENGRIRIPFNYSGRYRITEVRAANGYWLDPLEQNRTWIIEVRDNEDYTLVVENIMLPTLVIRKWNALRNRPVPMTQFRIEFEHPNSPNVELIGYRMTDQDGFIIIPFVGVGWYRVTETRPAPGMVLNSNNNYRIFLRPGQNTYQFLDRIGVPARAEHQLAIADNFETAYLDVDMIVPDLAPSDELTPELQSSQSLTFTNVRGVNHEVAPTNDAVSVFFDLRETGQTERLYFDIVNNTSQAINFEQLLYFGMGDAGHGVGLRVTTNANGTIAPSQTATGLYIELEVTNANLLANSVNNSDALADILAYLQFTDFVFLDFYIHVLTDNFGGEVVSSNVDIDILVPTNATVAVYLNGTHSRTLTTSTVIEVAQNTQVSLRVIPHDGYEVAPSWNDGNETYTFTATGIRTIVVEPIVQEAVEVPTDVEPDYPTNGENGEQSDEEETDESDDSSNSADGEDKPVDEDTSDNDNDEENGDNDSSDNSDNSNDNSNSNSSPPTDNLPNGWYIQEDGTILDGNGNLVDIPTSELPQGTMPPAASTITDTNAVELADLLRGAGNSETHIEYALYHFFGIEPSMGVPPGGIFGPDWDNDLDVWNWPANSIVVRKYNSVTGQLLSGATFNLIDISAGQQQPGGTLGTIIGTFTTGVSGTVVITGLYPGVYLVEEVVAPTNFTLAESNLRAARLNPDGFSIIALDFHNDPFGSLQITLRDSVTNLPLADGVFRVTNSHGQVVGTGNGLFTTNNQGQILIPNLAPASYNIEQINAPDGYRFGNIQTQNIFVNATGNIYNVDFLNIPPNTLTVTLRDSENLQPLAGGIFRVTESGGAVVGTTGGLFTTNAQGQFTLTIQPNTSYIVEQINPAPSHRLSQPVTQTIMTGQSGQNYVLDFTNEPYRGLIIISLDEMSGDPLQGVVYEVRQQDGTYVGTFTSNAQGRIELTSATGHELLGWFEVTQIEVPAGFEFDAMPQRNIQVTTQANAQMTFSMPRQGSLEITLTSSVAPFEPLAGGQFEVRTQAGNLIGLFTTNQAGGITIPNVGTGWVTIEPMQAPTGFSMDDPIRSVEVGTNAVARAAFTATPIADLVITLTDPQGNPLQGGLFVVRTVAGEELFRGTTTIGGTLAVSSITASTVVIEQLQAPTGFVMTDESKTMDIVQGQTNTARFVNTPIANLTIELVDPSGFPLPNGEFEVRTVAGELVHRGVTNQGGALAIPSITAGTFIITQTRASQGFVITDPARTITIVAGQNAVERFVNVREAIVTIEKVDVHGNPLAGATFEIREVNGNLIHRGVTNNGGLLTIDGLAPGTIIIEETIAPDGFIITEPARTITLAAGDIITERFVNERRSVFVVHKIDGDTNESLVGVVFELATLSGQRIQNPINMGFEFVTNNAGQITLPHLNPGTFVLTETRPLAGYQSTQPIVFSVGTDNEYLITVRNYRYPDLNIRKVSSATNQGMQGVVFTIAPLHANGTQGNPLRNPVDGSINWTTDSNGIIRVPNLQHGTYIATEISTHAGYRLAEPVIFVVDGSSPMTLTITNHRYSEWNILNIDGHTNSPIQGGRFEVAHFFGSGTTGDRLRNPLNGTFEFVGGANGLINLGVLEPGTYIITNVQAPSGFTTAEPVIFTVEDDSVNTTITVR